MKRRIFLKAITAAPVLAAPLGSACAGSTGRTSSDALGPFYPVEPIPQDSSLILADSFVGDELTFSGRVMAVDGDALPDTLIEIWQCDGNSAYNHPAASDFERDPAFRGFGATNCAQNGSFSFRTIVPVPYPGRPPHIHARLWRHNKSVLTTQVYVEGYRGPSNRKIAPQPSIESGETVYHAAFEFVL